MFSWNRLFDAKHLYRSRAGNYSRDLAPETSLTTTAKREGSWDGIIVSHAEWDSSLKIMDNSLKSTPQVSFDCR